MHITMDEHLDHRPSDHIIHHRRSVETIGSYLHPDARYRKVRPIYDVHPRIREREHHQKVRIYSEPARILTPLPSVLGDEQS
jgi:hypothetical protein